MKKPTRQSFLQDVRDEIEFIKQNATKEEKKKLVFKNFDTIWPETCVYGLLTGDCQNKRAISLIRQGCKRVFSLPPGKFLDGAHIDEGVQYINGPPRKKYFSEGWRNFQYMSSLEGYIQLSTSEKFLQGILSYIKGTFDTLILE